MKEVSVIVVHFIPESEIAEELPSPYQQVASESDLSCSVCTSEEWKVILEEIQLLLCLLN